MENREFAIPNNEELDLLIKIRKSIRDLRADFLQRIAASEKNVRGNCPYREYHAILM